MRGLALLWGLSAVACASSKRGDQQCDPNTMTCTIDAPVNTITDGGPDSPPDAPLAGFGQACTDNHQCQSGLCIIVGTSGQCTQTCGDCPTGYGCLGVVGIEVDGQVTFVCVPTSSQLCTPCTQDTECTLLGMDKCVTYADGEKVCARDCSTVACPTGYDCDTVNIGGTDFKQCIASSGSCDCNASTVGSTQPCNITTPWNVCLGSETCAGATGWGACQPPSTTDDPEDTYTDSNCDGIDGDLARGIFVSPAGVDTATCGLVYSDPCQTIGWGISRASSAGRPQVYVQAGTYNASITMVSGISVYGGYNFNWQRAPYSTAGHTVTIVGGVTAVTFSGLAGPTTLNDVVIRSADAITAGGSSIGVLVTGSQQVTLDNVLVQPGAGAPGVAGSDGAAGANGGNGVAGGPGVEHSSSFLCHDNTLPVGGPGGGSSCGRPGGAGGNPGVGSGTGATGASGTINPNSGGGGGVSQHNGLPGLVGSAGTAGTSGTGGGAFGLFSGFSYLAANGTSGAAGNSGNGGGGGGGGGGGTNNCDSSGSSGGGGGGGGCGGTAGTAGAGGGGSFGIIALDSGLLITSVTVNGGPGGAGGRGGTAGAGGLGGVAGAGGPYGGQDDQDDGGNGAGGGSGGHGGNGGGGGGGGGGPSIGVVCLGTSTTTTTTLASTLTPGTGGTGGASASAPGAPGTSAGSHGCP